MNNKELILRIDAAEAATIDAVNQIIQTYGLPFFLFEPIIEKVYRQVLNGKKDELRAAQARESVIGLDDAAIVECDGDKTEE